MESTADRQWRAARAATRVLSNERPQTMRERLDELAASPFADGDRPLDAYGNGIVEQLEARVAELLGTESALWFPTGTMAQQAALRVWATRAGTPRIAVHPLHHTQLQEEEAFGILSGLVAVHPTTEPRHPTPGEVEAVPGPLAAAVLELPMQELGYVLPTWDEYVAVAGAARRRGVPLHLDGARLWEARVRFRRSPADIVGHASSVYVSLYKGVGGLSGAALAGDREFIAAARPWRTRYGGDLFRQFPAIVAALDGLDRRLDAMPAWVEHAMVVAAGLRTVPGLRVTPDPPHINEFWVHADLPADAINQAVLEHTELAGERWLHDWWAAPDGGSLAEATINDAGLAWSAEDVASAGRRILRRAAEIAAARP